MKTVVGIAVLLCVFAGSSTRAFPARERSQHSYSSGLGTHHRAEQPQPAWEEMTSIEDLYAAYPERLKSVFEHLNLESEGLEKAKQAYSSGDVPSASKYVLDYYERAGIRKTFAGDVPPVSHETVPAADSIVQDIITIQGVSDQVPRLASGHLDWGHTGPEEDMEYAWLHNRHGAVSTLLQAWLDTGNPTYARRIDHYIKDWIISSWPYPGVKSTTAMWRGLEVSFRVKRWAKAFYQLMGTEYLSPATRLLMLSSLPDHAHYARNFHAQGNWLTMEISGLATVAAYWPEFEASSDWLAYAIDTMAQSMEEQVYPDGVQTELTSSYHQVALRNFSQFMEICDLAKVRLPDFYAATLEKMWNYLAATMRPDGYGLLNNDADLKYNRDAVQEAAATYHRPDWQHIASNGRSGTRPAHGPSFVFPWAGHLTSRSDYGPDAQWSFFDIGPWGSGHQHNDKLHLSVAAFGRDLLVDAGRFAYRGRVADRFRDYALGSRSHNVVLIDGKEQGPGPERAAKPLPESRLRVTDAFDYASASFDHFAGLEGEGRHTRALLYARGAFWIVADHIATDRPREITALWHWHPEASVRKMGRAVVSTDHERGNLKIIPAGQTGWRVDFVKGQDAPVVQGWYSREYNTYEPNTATIYRTHVQSDATFVWVLFPSEEAAPEVTVEVVSRDARAVDVRVSVPGEGCWDATVPFLDSAEAEMTFVSE